jgi:ADP-heptose:LPS heptosyltransferase
VQADPVTRHHVDDWLALMQPFGGVMSFEPKLAVSDDERERARERLAGMGLSREEGIIAVHGGASQRFRRWPMDSYRRVADTLAERHGAKVLYFRDPRISDDGIPENANAVRTTLREMMAIMELCSVILCNDSGPMHVADALDVPVVGVFTTGNPVWHRPYRSWQKFAGKGTGHAPLEPAREEVVLALGEAQLRRGRG